LTITTSPEFPEIGLAQGELYVRVGIKFEDAGEGQKVPLDIVCVMDNSGSMGGGKLASLKTAMGFVIDSLGEHDRLSVVAFNSTPTTLHGLVKMTADNKNKAKAALDNLRAEGGTDILAGMAQGWSVMHDRRSHNPASCVFLLTDGQDRGSLEQKLALGREMKTAGASVFVFGFGADHDSEHMENIANAAEGNFTYIESDDMVADAFGGTIGIQQGTSLSNITLSVTALEREVCIQQIAAGRYTTMLQADKRSGTVSFVNMYMGESRDVLLKLVVPESEAVEDYEILSASATFHIQGEGGQHTADSATCLVQRVSDLQPQVRDLNVDVQLSRIDCTATVADALRQADAHNLGSARELLAAAKARLQASVAYLALNPIAVGMMQELEDALVRVQTRTQYESGGRAMMQEGLNSNNYQRSTYCKAGKAKKYQTDSSSRGQERFCNSKVSK